MKKNKLFIKSIALLLGLIVCISVTSPVETYADDVDTATTTDIIQDSTTIDDATDYAQEANEVATYAAGVVTLDIVDGSIVISGSGWTQGSNSGSEVDVTITGTSTTANTITVNGGDPTITFSNLKITRTDTVFSKTPVLNINSNATIKLVGTNKMDSNSAGKNETNQTPRHNVVVIKSGATCTVKGDGSLTILGCVNFPAITGDGTFKMEGGTVSATSDGSVPALGGDNTDLNAELHGGSLTLSAPGYSYAKAAVVNNLTISGGLLKASNKSSEMESPNQPVCVTTKNFTMSGGTLSFPSVNKLGVLGTANITGGNVNSFYNGNEVNGRTLTKLYVTDDSGAPITGREVTITIKEGNIAREWSAIPDSNGVITTYLAANEQPFLYGVPGIMGANGWTFTTKVNRLSGTDWTVTVPASLNPGGSGTVTAYGTWEADTTLGVTASNTVTLENGSMALAPLNVNFTAIALQGSDSGMVIDTKTVSVEDFSETKPAPVLGTWTGTIVYTVEIIGPPELTGIAVTTAPTKTVYTDGETFDPTGMVLTANYSNNTSADVTSDCTYDKTTLTTIDAVEDQKVTFTYGGKTTTLDITVNPKALNDYSWAQISAISAAGHADAYFDIGDTKSITINGTVGNNAFSNVELDAIIIGINHNSSLEGTNMIHFLIGGKDGKLVGLVDEKYGNRAYGAGDFIMNTENVNGGGWASSQMRSNVLGGGSTPSSPTANTLLSALPAELLSALKPVTKYTNNAGNSNNTAAAVTPTTEYLFLLSEGEVDGISNMSSPAEDSFVKKYDYFKTNSAVAYKYNDTTTRCNWHLRSPNGDGNAYFSYVDGSGSCTSLDAGANYSRALLAGFVV